MSMGLDRPSWDFCMISCDMVHLIPLKKEALSTIMKPARTNSVLLYVNMARPTLIISTISIRLQCFFSSLNRIENMRMKTMLVDLVMVYRATSMNSKLHWESAMSSEATTATRPMRPNTELQPGQCKGECNFPGETLLT